MIEIQLQQHEVRVGGRISGVVTWSGQGAKLRRISVSVGWQTGGRGIMAKDTLWELRATPETNSPIVQVPFAFEIPDDGPISYDGHLIHVIWELRVLVKVRRGADEQLALPFVVVPRRIAPGDCSRDSGVVDL